MQYPRRLLYTTAQVQETGNLKEVREKRDLGRSHLAVFSFLCLNPLAQDMQCFLYLANITTYKAAIAVRQSEFPPGAVHGLHRVPLLPVKFPSALFSTGHHEPADFTVFSPLASDVFRRCLHHTRSSSSTMRCGAASEACVVCSAAQRRRGRVCTGIHLNTFPWVTSGLTRLQPKET